MSKLREGTKVARGFESLGDLFLFLRIFCVALVIPLLARLPLPLLQRLMTGKGDGNVGAPVEKIVRYVDAVRTIGYPLVRRRCLTRGLTLYYFLTRAGVDVNLCFGVAEDVEGFMGHCWLVRQGEPYLELGDEQPTSYSVMYRFEGQRQRIKAASPVE